jgi:hypothetical protein
MDFTQWSDEQWRAEIESDEWASAVFAAFLNLFNHKPAWLKQVRLISADLGYGPEHIQVIKVVYDHLSSPKRLGLCRRIDRIPTAVFNEMSPQASLATEIAMYDIAEPLGTIFDQLVPGANNVWWWGDL